LVVLDMTTTNQNAFIRRGDTASIDVTLTDAAGEPYDVNGIGGELKYRIARNWHTPENEALVLKSLGNGITAAGNIATVEISEADSDLDPGVYYHELKIIKTPDVSTAMTGTVIIRKALKMSVPLEAANLASGAPEGGA
jgi:hypothetical protein